MTDARHAYLVSQAFLNRTNTLSIINHMNKYDRYLNLYNLFTNEEFKGIIVC